MTEICGAYVEKAKRQCRNHVKRGHKLCSSHIEAANVAHLSEDALVGRKQGAHLIRQLKDMGYDDVQSEIDELRTQIKRYESGTKRSIKSGDPNIVAQLKQDLVECKSIRKELSSAQKTLQKCESDNTDATEVAEVVRGLKADLEKTISSSNREIAELKRAAENSKNEIDSLNIQIKEYERKTKELIKREDPSVAAKLREDLSEFKQMRNQLTATQKTLKTCETNSAKSAEMAKVVRHLKKDLAGKMSFSNKEIAALRKDAQQFMDEIDILTTENSFIKGSSVAAIKNVLLEIFASNNQCDIRRARIQNALKGTGANQKQVNEVISYIKDICASNRSKLTKAKKAATKSDDTVVLRDAVRKAEMELAALDASAPSQSIVDKRQTECTMLIGRLTKYTTTDAKLTGRIRNLVRGLCAVSEKITKVRGKPIVKSVARGKSGGGAVKKAAAITYTAEELERIREKVENSKGLVVVTARIRCTSSRGQMFTAGVDPSDNGKNIIQAGNVKISRSKTNFRVFDDNAHLAGKACSDISSLGKRNGAFYKSNIEPFVDPDLSTTVIAFGQSGSGKTTTVNYILKRIYSKIGNEHMSSATVSFVDVYNDKAVDLLRYKNVSRGINRRDKKEVDDIVMRRMQRNIMNRIVYRARMCGENDGNCSENSLTFEQIHASLEEDESVMKDLGVSTLSEFKKVFHEVYIRNTEVLDSKSLTAIVYKSSAVRDGKATYLPVRSYENYTELFKYAQSIRPVTVTPENTGGSSRSHLIIKFNLSNGNKLSLIDLAGSEDYSGMSASAYSQKLREVGIFVPRGDRTMFGGVGAESEFINKSLRALTNYLLTVNRALIRKRGLTVPKESGTHRSSKEALVQYIEDAGVFGHSGRIMMVVTMKSDSDPQSLEEAKRTIKVLDGNGSDGLIPSDAVLNKIGS